MNLTNKMQILDLSVLKHVWFKLFSYFFSILGAVFETENPESDINNEISSKHIIFS